MKQITIGTRASKLAMAQTHLVIERLQRLWPGLEIAIEQIRTTGDRVTDLPLSQIGGDGVFVTEIERALHEKRIDLAVHSLKDLPTAQPDELCLVITGPREDVRDVLISNEQTWSQQRVQDDRRSVVGAQLIAPQEGEGTTRQQKESTASVGARLIAPEGGGEAARQQKESKVGVGARLIAPQGGGEEEPERGPNLRIGTSSLRRTAQIRALWPEAQILSIRGNVDTRLRKLEANKYDAIVVAAAGLHRLDLQGRLADRVMYFPVELMLPAPGQGALALEIRDEPEMRELLSPLQDPIAQATTTAERMFMRRLGAGCYLPVAAYGEIADGTFTLLGLVISLDGQRQVRVGQSIPWTAGSSVERAQQLGIKLAEQALAEGADEIIGTIESIREQEHQRV